MLGWVEGAMENMIEEACRTASFHEFVRDLSDGHETILGWGDVPGAALSDGEGEVEESERTNPRLVFHFISYIFTYFFFFRTDEATSALDPTSRILAFEALKRWRKNRTTIVITHDLSQIEPNLARPTLRPLTLGNWMFDVVVDLMSTKPHAPASAVMAARVQSELSALCLLQLRHLPDL
jgi:hypothetical protein